jgi:hypothetical protein
VPLGLEAVMIEVGSTVVCVNDSEPPQPDSPYVVKGNTYTVARIERKPWPVAQFMVDEQTITIFKEIVMIWVEGLPSQTGHFGFRFRKVEKKKEESKTDISIFTRMLDKQPERIK